MERNTSFKKYRIFSSETSLCGLEEENKRIVDAQSAIITLSLNCEMAEAIDNSFCRHPLPVDGLEKD